MRVYENPNKEELKEIVEAVTANEGYCPCALEKTPDTKCACKAFRDMTEADFCHCGRFYKVPECEILALVGDITDGDEEFEQWEILLSKQDFIVLPVKFDAENIYHHSESYSSLCKTKIHKADAVFILDDETDWILDMEVWSNAIGKRVLHRRDLRL